MVTTCIMNLISVIDDSAPALFVVSSAMSACSDLAFSAMTTGSDVFYRAGQKTSRSYVRTTP
ncbi:hypothetical protein QSI_0243 [Clostridioides difficile P28]|nr:hypothetical protein QSI_0243 [Clostridioides difficile P28]